MENKKKYQSEAILVPGNAVTPYPYTKTDNYFPMSFVTPHFETLEQHYGFTTRYPKCQ
jgi:hypothetical protein